MENERGISLKTKIILGLYSAGIIVGGGILALPFVALDSGVLFLIVALVVLGAIFNVIYWRVLDGVSKTIDSEKALEKFGLMAFDKALIESGLRKWGRIAFVVGILLYVYPADIVYILYGMKSLIQLSGYFEHTIFHATILMISALCIFAIAIIFFNKYKTPTKALLVKISLMAFIWTVAILLITTFSQVRILTGAVAFASSVIVGEFFPERFFPINSQNEILEDVTPRHRAQAILTIFKLTLIISVPILALIIIFMAHSFPKELVLFPKNYIALIDSVSIIMFMYVGSGVYNILIYPWILRNINEGKKIVTLGVIFSMIAYLIFSLIIVSIVDYNILYQSDINREHSFISLSRKLEAIGFSLLAYIVIGLAALFALVSVAVAYIGFTDTLSERLEIDLNKNRDVTWILVTIIVVISVILLEYFNVSKIATDALGIAGNAGGGLFLLTLPWLIKTSKDKGKIWVAVIFLMIITGISFIMIISATTIVAEIAGIIALLLIVVFGSMSIIESKKGK